MENTLSQASLAHLAGVDPRLENIVKLAIQHSPQNFIVVQGRRSREECAVNFGKGRTVAECAGKGVEAKYAQPTLAKVTWLADPFASKHTTGHAVDLCPIVNDKADWNDLARFAVIAKAMKFAAAQIGVPIAWGGEWHTSKDYPHFEI